MTIESPCNLVCTIDPLSGYCLGCGRTGDEIAGWTALSPTARRDLMSLLPDRLAALPRQPRRETRRSMLARARVAGGSGDA